MDENKFLPIELKVNATGNLTKVTIGFFHSAAEAWSSEPYDN